MMYAIQMASADMTYSRQFHEDSYRRSSNIKVLPHQFEWL
jgi:hypothetical protein